MTSTHADLMAVGTRAALTAGAILIKLQRKGLVEVIEKADGSLVTEADRRAEVAMSAIIREAYPEHGLHAEETGRHSPAQGSEYCWVFDPLDGTWAYLLHEHTPCVNLALLQGSQVVLGIIYNPFTSELFQVCQDAVATLNGRPLPTCRWDSDELNIISYKLGKRARPDIHRLLDMWGAGLVGKLVSQGGAPSYALAMVAKGTHASFLMACNAAQLAPWDFAAGVMLVRGAGGLVTDLNGRDVDPLKHSAYIIASGNDVVHAQVLELYRRHGVGESDTCVD